MKNATTFALFVALVSGPLWGQNPTWQARDDWAAGFQRPVNKAG